MNCLGDRVELKPEGYAVDRTIPTSSTSRKTPTSASAKAASRWPHRDGHAQARTLRAGETYVLPWGTKIRLEKQTGGTAWRLVGSAPTALSATSPAPSPAAANREISKSHRAASSSKARSSSATISSDIDQVAEILNKDFSSIYKKPARPATAPSGPILSPERSLGSVIKLLTPSAEYTDEYNDWLRALPQTIRQLVCHGQALLPPGMGRQLARALHRRPHQRVPRPRAEIRQPEARRQLPARRLRPEGSWRIYKLRPDFNPADKVQVEDDITASVVLPRESLNNLDPGIPQPERQARGQLRGPALPAARRRHPPRLRQAAPKPTSPRPATSSRTSSRSPSTGARRWSTTSSSSTSYTEPDEAPARRLRRTPARQSSSSPPRIRAWWTASPSKNPRYLQQPPDLVQSARSLSCRDRHAPRA